jgi:hypothetical protein
LKIKEINQENTENHFNLVIKFIAERWLMADNTVYADFFLKLRPAFFCIICLYPRVARIRTNNSTRAPLV